MKKQFFTFLMMIALVIVAGSAMAQTAITPYAGSTYTYTLGGVLLNSAGSADVFLNTDGGGLTPNLNVTGNWSLANAVDQDPTAIVTALDAGDKFYTLTLVGDETVIKFDITYASGITVGAYDLYVEITTGTCTNHIRLDVTVTAPPTLQLAVTSVADFCQNVGNVTNNTAGSDGQTNTFTFTITPTFSAGAVAAGAKYAYTFDISDYVIGAATPISIERTGGDGTDSDLGSPVTTAISVTGATDVQTITVTFATTTGVAAETITGTLGTTGVLTPGGTGTGTIAATYSPASEAVVVGTTPSIGTFTY